MTTHNTSSVGRVRRRFGGRAFFWGVLLLLSARCGFLAAQELVTDSAAPSSLAVQNGWIFWGVTPSEQCGRPGASQGLLVRVRGGGGDEERLGVGCRLNPIAVETDGLYVYYLNWADSSVERRWAGGGSAPTVLVEDANFGFKPEGIAIDGSHIYWADNAGIRRVSKDGGDTEMVVTGVDAQSIEVDGTHVYWSEGSYNVPRSGMVRRAPKDGGPHPEIELLDRRIVGPPHLALDATHVYWTGTNATVWKRTKSGSTVDRIVEGRTDFRGSAIALDDTHVFWSDGTPAGFTGRVRRVAKGGGRVDDLVLGSISQPQSLHIDGAHVVYSTVDSRHGAGIFRLLRDADAVLDDLWLLDMEITQGIQSLDNDVSLVQDKSTFVRVWATALLAETPNVEVILHGNRGGAALPGSPLESILPTKYVHRGLRVREPEREHLDSSFNFLLPDDWTSGEVTLTAQINPSRTIAERRYSNNTQRRVVTFTPSHPVCIKTVPVRTRGSGAWGPRSRQFHAGIERFRTLWPISEVVVHSQSSDIAEIELCWTGGLIPLPYPCYGPYELSSDGSKVLTALSLRRLTSNDVIGCRYTHWVGLVRSGAPPLDKGGRARTPGQYSWVRIRANYKFMTSSGSPFPPQGITLAHELAHNFGQLHVNCGAGNTDGSYPYCFDSCGAACPCCGIGETGAREAYGFDFLTQTVLPPDSVNSYMGYRDPRWVSSYHWERLLTGRNAVLGGEPAGVADGGVEGIGGQEWLFVQGIVNEADRTGEIEFAYRFAPGLVSEANVDSMVEAQREQDGGLFDYILRLVDERGRPLSTERFRLAASVGQEPLADTDDRGFAIVLPWHARTTTVRLVQDGETIATKSAGGSPPTVRVIEPNGGEVIGNRLVVRWEASDPDGIPLRPLYFIVQLSPDGGRTWQALTTNVTERELVIDPANDLPGGDNARIRVIATDGLNTAYDQSDSSFRVLNREPSVFIFHPEDGDVFAPGEQIFASGSGWDPEDGTLDGSALVWSIGSQDITRAGRQTLLPGLPPGTYRIRLYANDQDRASARDEIEIIVADGGGKQRPGDINQDARLDISDAIGVLGFLFLGGGDFEFLPCGDGSPGHEANVQLLDSNGDARLDLSDPVYVLQFLFIGGPAPVLGSECVRLADCPNNSECP